VRGSRCSAFSRAREARGDGFSALPDCPFSYARSAFFLVDSEVFPLAGGFRGIPARLALLSPMAIACFAERAPCFPSRTCSISSWTNSPAAVDGALPSRRSSSARFFVDSSGIFFPFPTLFQMRARDPENEDVFMPPSMLHAIPLGPSPVRSGTVPATAATQLPEWSRSPQLRALWNKCGSDRRGPPSLAPPAPLRP
jgi:hypothetical protein